MRFIDEHCVDSEEIRSEMQKDIDRLVIELEEQCKQNRTAESLQSQVDRLESEYGDTQYKLKLADENQKRAEALLAARMEEKDQEVGDLNAEIKWFRQEYDALLLKVSLPIKSNSSAIKHTFLKSFLKSLLKLTNMQQSRRDKGTGQIIIHSCFCTKKCVLFCLKIMTHKSACYFHIELLETI